MKEMGTEHYQWRSRIEARGVAAYLLARQKAGGGFGMTPRLPATVEDTYYSFRALELLGATGRVRHLRRFLALLPPSATSPAKVLFQQAWLQRRCRGGLGGLVEALRIRLARHPDLSEVYYALRAARELPQAGLAAAVGQAAPGQVGRWRTVTDLWRVLVLRDFLGLPPPPGAANWLLACQNRDGGFGFLPGTTSFLENTFHGLRSARYLGEGLRWPEACAHFVLRCASGAGGFGRTSSAVPSPETTYMALASLWLLDDLAARRGGQALPGPTSEQEAQWRPTAS